MQSKEDYPATIYAVCMKDTPLRYQYKDKPSIIIANASALSQQERKQITGREACFFDDDMAGSISHLNPWWGELTAIHWMIDNCHEEWLGNCQYRRYWDEDSLKCLRPGAIYLSYPADFGCSLAQQFMGGHSFQGVELTMDMARRGKLPFTVEEMASVWNSTLFQGGPMAVAENEHYKKLMGVLFDCLWPLWEEYKDYFQELEGYDKRALGFLSERFLSGIVQFKNKFLGPIHIQHIPQLFIGP